MFYPWAVNSQLEAKDNYDYPYPYFIGMDETLPKPINGNATPCKTTCSSNCDTKVYEGREWERIQEQQAQQYDVDSDSESETRSVRSESSDYGY